VTFAQEHAFRVRRFEKDGALSIPHDETRHLFKPLVDGIADVNEHLLTHHYLVFFGMSREMVGQLRLIRWGRLTA
jgi:hypothetical protein